VFDKVTGSLDNVETTVVDIDEQPELASKFKVMAVPTVVFEKDGKEISRFSGALPESAFLDKVEDALRNG
jgi:thioredoxin 1